MVAKLQTSLHRIVANMRWVFAYVWRQTRTLFLLLILLWGLAAIIPTIQVLTTRILINSVVVGASTGEIDGQIILWLGISTVAALAYQTISSAKTFVSQRFRRFLHERLTVELLEHADTLDLKVFENPDYQDMIARAQDNMSEHVANFIDRSLALITGLFEVTSLIIILFTIDITVVLLVVPIALLYAIIDWWLARARFRNEYDRTSMYRWTGYYSYNLLNFRNIPEVRVLALGRYLIGRYHDLLKVILGAVQQLDNSKTRLDFLFGIAFLSAFYITFLRVITRAIQGFVTVGDVVVYAQVALQLRTRFQALSGGLSGAYQETLYISNLIAFLALQPENSSLAPNTPSDISLKGNITFEHVTFQYPNAPTPSLENVSFTLQAGEIVAVMGANGAGKSTLVKLLSRLYTPTSGSIHIGDLNVNDIAMQSYHQRLSVLFQNYNNYEMTVHENIAVGDWKNLLEDRAQVRRIAEALGFDEMINKLPQGYDTDVGLVFHKNNLSGGQLQKLALARILAKPADLLILDEPTASMDIQSEHNLFRYLSERSIRPTTIIISHRFSTLRMAPRILVFEEGRLIEQGTHQDLLDFKGQYASVYKLHGNNLA